MYHNAFQGQLEVVVQTDRDIIEETQCTDLQCTVYFIWHCQAVQFGAHFTKTARREPFLKVHLH